MNNLQEPRTRLHISGTTPYLIGAKESNQIKRLQTLETFSVSTSFSTHFFSSWSDRILFLLVFLSRETRIFVCVHCFQPSHFFALSLSLSLPPCSPRIVTHNELCHTFSVAIWTSCLMMIHRGKTACLYYSQKIYINVHKHTQMCRILGSFDGTIPTWLALKRAHNLIFKCFLLLETVVLEPLIEGLCAQIHVNLRWRVFGRNRINWPTSVRRSLGGKV